MYLVQGVPLKDYVLNLFHIATNRAAVIAYYWLGEEGHGCWIPWVTGSFNYWKLEMVESFSFIQDYVVS